MGQRELHFYPEHHCYFVKWDGTEVTAEDTLQHWQELARNAQYDASMDALHDLRGCHFESSYVAALKGARIYQSTGVGGTGKVGVLVDDVLAFGMMRQLTVVMDLDDSLVTYDEAEAKALVGLPRDFALPAFGATAGVKRPAT
jgi:hypothetical protein